MNLGEKIVELRKKNHLSQEELAEQVGVTRQTISKWEWNETAPDIKDAKALSNIFKISLDELVNNDVKDIIVEKVSNTEKLAGLIIRIIKGIGIALLILFIIDIMAFALFTVTRKKVTTTQVENVTMNCSIQEDYMIEMSSDGHWNCINCSNEMQEEMKQKIDYSNLDDSVKNIEQYFTNKQGKCE